jgi:hypothetical protein
MHVDQLLSVPVVVVTSPPAFVRHHFASCPIIFDYATWFAHFAMVVGAILPLVANTLSFAIVCSCVGLKTSESI